MTAPIARRQAVHDFKRQAILKAAGTIFAEQGLEGATIRAIAAAAGYTPGAIYAYYDSKEAIYGDMLGESLGQLARSVKAAAAGAGADRYRVAAAARAFYDFYRGHPRELELGLYLANGMRANGLTPELDRQLNGRLIAVLQTLSNAIAAYAGVPDAVAHRETVLLTASLCGILLLQATGRLKVLGQDGDSLVDQAIADLLERLAE